MDRKEIIEFLEVLLCRLQNDGAGARKIDMVAEAMGVISAANDERAVREQLLRVNELMESLYGGQGAGQPAFPAGAEYTGAEYAGAPGGVGHSGGPGAPDSQFMARIRRITDAAHQECMVMGENFANTAGELAGTVERDIEDLAKVRASYDDLVNRQRLVKRMETVKGRYQSRLKRQSQGFISDVVSVYDNAMDKVKSMFARPEAGNMQMTQKQIYERFDAGHETFLVRAQNVGNSLELSGDAFEKLADRLGKKVAGVKKKATVVTVLVLLLSMAVWGILLGTAGKKAYDAAADCMEMVDNLKDPDHLLDGMGGMGGMAKMMLDNDMVKNAVSKAVEAPVQAITKLVSAMKTILIILVICVLCFYVAFVPFLVWFRRCLCIHWLEPVVLAETSMFLGEVQPVQQLSQATQEIIAELERMYGALYQDLWIEPADPGSPAPAPGGRLTVTEEAAADELIRTWRQLTVRYGI